MFCPTSGAIYLFSGSSSWSNKGRQLPKKEHLNTQALIQSLSVVSCLNIIKIIHISEKIKELVYN